MTDKGTCAQIALFRFLFVCATFSEHKREGNINAPDINMENNKSFIHFEKISLQLDLIYNAFFYF